MLRIDLIRCHIQATSSLHSPSSQKIFIPIRFSKQEPVMFSSLVIILTKGIRIKTQQLNQAFEQPNLEIHPFTFYS
jgi:hypothetical protein